MSRPEGFTQPDGMARGLPNCGIVALGVACGVDYQTAYEAVREARRRQGRRVDSTWKGRTYHPDLDRATQALGYWLEPVAFTAGRTLRLSLPLLAEEGASYIVQTRGHKLAYRDGVLVDQHGACVLRLHSNRNLRLKGLWRVDPL